MPLVPHNQSRLPRPIVIGIVVVCVLPILLNLSGVDFSSHSVDLDVTSWSDMTHAERSDHLHE